MFEFLVLFVVLIILGVAAIRWGVTSSDGLDSEEWERREQHAWARLHTEAQPDRYIIEQTVPVFYEEQMVRAASERQAEREMCAQC